MIDNSNKVLKSGVWYTVCNFIVKIASFVTMPIFTRLMTKSDVGYFSNILSWVSIITIIATFDLYSSVTIARFDFKDKLEDYIGSTLVLGTIITGIFYIITIVFKDFFLNFFQIDMRTLHLIFSYCLVCPAVQMYQIKSRLFYKYKISVAITLLTVFSSIISSLVLVLMLNDQLWGRTFGYFCPQIVINIIIYVYILVNTRKIKLVYWKYALMISFPLIWHHLAGVLLSSSDRIMITHYCGASENALYSMAYSCAMVVSVLWSSMNTAWSPWAYEKMDEHNYKDLEKASKPYILFFSFVVVVFMIIAPEIVVILGGKAYRDASLIIPPIMIGYVFQFIYSLYVNIEFYHKKQKWIAIGTLMSAMVNILLNLIFIPILGYRAAAYTTLAGYIILFSMHFIVVRKMGKTYWYDTKFNLKILLAFMLLIPVSIVLYDHTILRLSFISIYILIIVGGIIYLRNEIILSIKIKKISPIINKIEKIMKKVKGN